MKNLKNMKSEKNAGAKKNGLRTLGLGAAGALALTALVSGTTPASAASYTSFKNAHTGLCLAGATDRTVSQYSCSTQDSAAIAWTLTNNVAPFPFGMLKNSKTGMCLDTNGADVYLSGCVSEDAGQSWWFNGDKVVSLLNGRSLTGWNADGVAVVADGEADVLNKQRWSW
ncbi:ricin-type beta-trefoil lectin domain protein [Streptomyces sp. NBC_00102]|uniref:ricin-type beta-trefoil lectin domain protein n=1 Tax=Streptomyces sp. NBC_00102 TaxID=2975652 RepID=UPI002251643E|nr:ricin-type beta-trefoil lectin domain protein [Streptomyces sp. NBC_00102]MCX5400466.1 RICIN domain-containing protein [Streptomyces sp. NBC_00102]